MELSEAFFYQICTNIYTPSVSQLEDVYDMSTITKGWLIRGNFHVLPLLNRDVDIIFTADCRSSVGQGGASRGRSLPRSSAGSRSFCSTVAWFFAWSAGRRSFQIFGKYRGDARDAGGRAARVRARGSRVQNWAPSPRRLPFAQATPAQNNC
jgi:hypothetical protein